MMSIDQLSSDDQRAVEALQSAIRIRTVSHRDPVQVDREAFDDFIELLQGRFPLLHQACTVTRLAGDALLLRWAGTGDADPVVLMAHIDVVPINPDDHWTHPPFDAVIDDGMIWGRGTLDCKGSLIALCVAAERLLAKGFTPSRDIWFSFGCDEEVAGPAATAAVEELAGLGVSPWFVLDEGGAVALGGFPGVKRPLAVIGIAEKGLVDVQLRTTDEGGHASTPARGGATARLARAIVRLDRDPFPINLPDATVQMLRTAAAHAPAPIRLAVTTAARSPKLLARLLQKLGPETAAMTRTTDVVTQLSGAPGANVIAANATAVVNVRVMVGETVAAAVERIRRTVKDRSVEISVISASEPSPVSPTDEAFELLTEVIRQTIPDAVPVPYIVMAATDGRYFHRRWPRVYRFNPFRMTRQQRGTLHNVDERIGVSDFLEGVGWYTRLMESV
ncbi:M20/M25/M40 family metallo-hydrolase [Nakamurella lactea]|uniref:M20/M25/M40 family metallo-hydrolase n=1 Tax=Nakamurella lactea TaxID=459515 RepID=UPI000424131B|nr:M20/M25/M40 family metallo-hydrolase [Nakamurella lactea]